MRAAVLASLLVLVPAIAGAVPPFDVPHADRSPEVDGDRAVVTAAALGAPDERLGRLSAVRLAARHEARARALRALHAWADEAMAAVRACPREAVRVHEAIDRAASVAGVRAVVDGGAVVLVEVPLGALREAAALTGVPWSG